MIASFVDAGIDEDEVMEVVKPVDGHLKFSRLYNNKSSTEAYSTLFKAFFTISSIIS